MLPHPLASVLLLLKLLFRLLKNSEYRPPDNQPGPITDRSFVISMCSVSESFLNVGMNICSLFFCTSCVCAHNAFLHVLFLRRCVIASTEFFFPFYLLFMLNVFFQSFLQLLFCGSEPSVACWFCCFHVTWFCFLLLWSFCCCETVWPPLLSLPRRILCLEGEGQWKSCVCLLVFLCIFRVWSSHIWHCDVSVSASCSGCGPGYRSPLDAMKGEELPWFTAASQMNIWFISLIRKDEPRCVIFANDNLKREN